jgi:uncharacterized RDD family membrane protein YckC
MDTPPPPLPPPPDQLGAMPAWRAADAPTTPRYAGFWIRFLALVIDGIVLTPVSAIFLWPVIDDIWNELQRTNFEDGTVRFELWFDGGVGRWFAASFAVALISYAYNAVMIGMWGATVGKFAVGIRVRRPDETPATWREAFLRPILPAFAGFVGGGLLGLLDYLWMLWDRQKQTLHDKIASTIVVQK